MSRTRTLFFLTSILAIPGLAFSVTNPPRGVGVSSSARSASEKHILSYLDGRECDVFLAPFGLEEVRCEQIVPGANLLLMKGTYEQLRKARLVLDVVDCLEDYCVENLGPASQSGTLPSLGEIEAALGNISIGTFDKPPVNYVGAGWRGIIDVQGDSTVAFIPARHRERLGRLLAAHKIEQAAQSRLKSRYDPSAKPSDVVRTRPKSGQAEPKTDSKYVVITSTGNHDRRPTKSDVPTSTGAKSAPSLTAASSQPGPGRMAGENMSGAVKPDSQEPKTVRIVFEQVPNSAEDDRGASLTDKAVPGNGEDLLDMTLPETITLIQLLDLVGKYMNLNYVYDPREIPNQSVALKLNGNLQGEMKVKNLYALLKTVLDIMGLAMIRQEENLVAVVKIDKALQTQPELVDKATEAVQIGDTVVVRAFNIRHVNILSVASLLESMKLSVAVTPVENVNVLLVTCHADRMNRVEQLVEMIDRPGRPLECRFRRLYHTTAAPLVAKISTLAQEIEGIAIAHASTTVKPSPNPVVATAPKPAQPKDKRSVFLDVDERTNRILMIGSEEELAQIEQLVDALDVAQADPRSVQIYDVRNIDAKRALEKLDKLEVLNASPAGAAEAGSNRNALTAEPLVTILEATNQLLVRATPDQQRRIGEFLGYIDVVPESIKTLAYYEIRNIKAAKAREMLEELDLVATGGTAASTVIEGPNTPALSQVSRAAREETPGFLSERAQVVVSESTNALLIKATTEQHERLGEIIKFIDRKMPEEELSYRIYPLENSSPEHISGMLEQLLGKSAPQGEEGKIIVASHEQEEITIVPDSNTFSLVVHASQRNHEWIDELIHKLDKRRPQVLIDVTLVEVTRTDTFEYDLNLVANAKDAVVGNVVIDSIQKAGGGSRLEAGFNLLDQEGNATGQTKAFYSDQKVQALLTAIQRKNYGRVLAKPKVLVDDGQEGRIETTDETTYVKESIQIPQTGTPITTRDFVPIQASILLQITPHIGEGDLLRLDVHLSRDDFGSRPLSGAPPDKATSEVETTVFVPDDNTVILGGLVKLNQSKGGSKIPILGDVPLVGGLFRSVNNSDVEKKLYVFLRANIVRPYEESKLTDLRRMSDEHRSAFEKSEAEFQKLQDIPGITPDPMQPERVLKDYQ